MTSERYTEESVRPVGTSVTNRVRDEMLPMLAHAESVLQTTSDADYENPRRRASGFEVIEMVREELARPSGRRRRGYIDHALYAGSTNVSDFFGNVWRAPGAKGEAARVLHLARRLYGAW